MATKKNPDEVIINQENTENLQPEVKTKKVDKNKQLAIDAFNNWPSVHKLYQTIDGTCFFTVNAAQNHVKSVGGDIVTINRHDTIKQDGAE